MTKVRFAMVGLCILCGCSDSTAPTLSARSTTGRPAVVENDKVPAALTTTNPCNGDVVVLTGTSHVMVKQMQLPNGTFHLDLDVISQYTGVGVPSGLSYQGTSRDSDHFTSNTGFPVTESFVSEVSLRSSGKGANYSAGIKSDYTINANGEVTANHAHETDRCNG